MTITQLRYVILVATYQNFSKAAQKSLVTQPTLSMQIQKLEEELGILIFNRSTKPLKITEVGLKIVEQAQKIVNEANRMQDIVDQQKGYVGGEFKLGIIATVMPTLVPHFLKTFHNKYPKVQLIIEELQAHEILHKLSKGTLDAAITSTPLSHENIVERVLYYEPFVAYLNKEDPLFKQDKIRAKDLVSSELLVLEEGNCFRNNVLNLFEKVIDPKIEKFQIQSSSIETLLKLVDEGLGMTIIPYLYSMHLNENKKKHLRFFKNPMPAREISIIQHKSQLKSHIVDAIYEVILSKIKGLVAFQDVTLISPLIEK